MPYLPLPNFKYDSGPRRIQSGPDHEGYVVLYSGVQSTGADDGIVVAGAPLSGTLASGVWGYDANWRYVPSTLQTQSGGVDPTPYNASGALDTYDGVRISTRNTVAGAQIASAIGPQPGSTANTPERYMYFGGAAPDNQNYSPYNTPDANSAAEGKTGGGVTHRTFESSLLTNVLGSQGTSDRSQWRYHQPVYCKTYTETRRSEVPGLMSTPLRSMYRGGATSYLGNLGYQLLAGTGFKPLEYDEYIPEETPEEPIIIDSAPFLWWSYTTEGTAFPYYFDQSQIVLDRFCNSYHCLEWSDGSSFIIQVIKRDINGEIIWQKNYGSGVISLDIGSTGDNLEAESDKVNDIIYIAAQGSPGTYFLSLNLNGAVRFSKILYNLTTDFSGAYTIWSININPVSSYVTLAGSVRSNFYTSAGVILTFSNNGNLINSLTKVCNAPIIFGGADRDNLVSGVCYDKLGTMYISFRYRTQDSFFFGPSARNSALYCKINLNGNVSPLILVGNNLQQSEAGVLSVITSLSQSMYITENNVLYSVNNNNSFIALDPDTLFAQQTYLLTDGSGRYWAQLRGDGRAYIFTRGFGPDGFMFAFNENTLTTKVDIGTTGSDMRDGEISEDFNYAAASIGRGSTAIRYSCVGFNPFSSGTVTVASGSNSYSVSYASPPTVPSVLATGVFLPSSGTPFNLLGPGATHSDGWTFNYTEAPFSCPVSDTVSPVWIRVATSGTYDPSP